MFTYLEEIKNTSGSKAKEELVRHFVSIDPTFLEYLERTYNPRRIYGVRKFSTKLPEGDLKLNDPKVWDETKQLLERLENREVTGKAAIAEVEALASKLTKDEQEAFRRLLAGDVKCGINRATINRVVPGTIPEYPYMRCSLPKSSNLKKFKWQSGVYSQVKADGMFANLDYTEDDLIYISSRSGSLFENTHFSGIIQDVKAVLDKGFRYNGEMLVKRGEEILPREAGNGILNSILKGGELPDGHSIVYYIWDRIPLEYCQAKCRYEVPYLRRFEDLKYQLEKLDDNSHVKIIETEVVYSWDEAVQKHYKECIAKGLEGTVLKDPNAIWMDGTSKDQVKLKVEAEVDLRVVGYREGNGKNAATFGSLVCASEDGEIEVAVSGFTDAERERIHKELETWISEGRIVTVRANGILAPEGKKKSLFLPRFVEERLDKTTADDLKKIEQIFDNVGVEGWSWKR